MRSRKSDFERNPWRQALAVLACAALLYFLSGGAGLHHHTGSTDTPCHVCQALHMPALAAVPLALIPEAEQAARYSFLPEDAAPLDSFSLHRASRAPPAV